MKVRIFNFRILVFGTFVLDLPKRLDNIWSDRSPVRLPAQSQLVSVLRYVQRASIKTAVIS